MVDISTESKRKLASIMYGNVRDMSDPQVRVDLVDLQGIVREYQDAVSIMNNILASNPSTKVNATASDFPTLPDSSDQGTVLQYWADLTKWLVAHGAPGMDIALNKVKNVYPNLFGITGSVYTTERMPDALATAGQQVAADGKTHSTAGDKAAEPQARDPSKILNFNKRTGAMEEI